MDAKETKEEKAFASILEQLLHAADTGVKSVGSLTVRLRDYEHVHQCEMCQYSTSARGVRVVNTLSNLQTGFTAMDVHRLLAHAEMSESDHDILAGVIL